MAAYECVLTGKRLHHRSTREDNAHAHAWKACALAQGIDLGTAKDPGATLEIIHEELSAA
jgi:adenylate cyclase